MDKPKGPYYDNQPTGPCYHYPPDVQLLEEIEGKSRTYFCIVCGEYKTPGQTVLKTVRYRKYEDDIEREKVRQKQRRTGKPVEPELIAEG